MIRILIDARVKMGSNPGIETFVKTLVLALKSAQEHGFCITWLIDKENFGLRKCIPENQEWVTWEPQLQIAMLEDIQEVKASERFSPCAQNGKYDPRLLREPKELIHFEPDIVMFCSQDAFVTRYPSIYHPHDLQHFRFSENFKFEEIGWRSLAWTSFAEMAEYVVVGTNHVANDVVKFWRLKPEVIKIISIASMRSINSQKGSYKDSNSDLMAVLENLGDFFLYPASYYPHKNHLAILNVLARLIQSGHRVKLVLTGANSGSSDYIESVIAQLGLETHVCQMGFVSDDFLQQLFSEALAVVVPTKYESKSYPVEEAISLQVPVFASDIPGVHEQLLDKQFLFDPDNWDELFSKLEWWIGLSKSARSGYVRKRKTAAPVPLSEVGKKYFRLWNELASKIVN